MARKRETSERDDVKFSDICRHGLRFFCPANRLPGRKALKFPD